MLGGLLDLVIAAAMVQWLYLPGYLANTMAMLGGKWIPEMTGIRVVPIDGGRTMGDGNRILGDGKTWNGLAMAIFGGGLLALACQAISFGGAIFIPLTEGVDGAWFAVGGVWGTAFAMGCVMGLGTMIGDAMGSFVKRRRGLKREGEISSKAPLLDTLPFAVMTFAFGLLFLDGVVTSASAQRGMLALLILTPIIHRGVNIIGFKLGLKDVPY